MEEILNKQTESMPTNIVELAKIVAKAGLTVGQKAGEYINDFIDAIFDGVGND